MYRPPNSAATWARLNNSDGSEKMPGSYSSPLDSPTAPAASSRLRSTIIESTSDSVAGLLKSFPITAARMVPWPA